MFCQWKLGALGYKSLSQANAPSGHKERRAAVEVTAEYPVTSKGLLNKSSMWKEINQSMRGLLGDRYAVHRKK